MNKQASFSTQMTTALGKATARCWQLYGRFGFALEIFMDEILDGGFGFDIAISQCGHGEFYKVPGTTKVWERVTNIHQDKNGIVASFDYFDPAELSERIETQLEKNRQTTKKWRLKKYGHE